MAKIRRPTWTAEQRREIAARLERGLWRVPAPPWQQGTSRVNAGVEGFELRSYKPDLSPLEINQ